MWRAALEHRLRAEEDHPVLLSHVAKYRSLMPALALIVHLIDGVDAGTRGPVSGAAAAQAAAWCEYRNSDLCQRATSNSRLFASISRNGRAFWMVSADFGSWCSWRNGAGAWSHPKA